MCGLGVIIMMPDSLFYLTVWFSFSCFKRTPVAAVKKLSTGDVWQQRVERMSCSGTAMGHAACGN